MNCGYRNRALGIPIRRLALAFVLGEIVSIAIAFNLGDINRTARKSMRDCFGESKACKIATMWMLTFTIPAGPILTVAIIAAWGTGRAGRVTRCRRCGHVLRGLTEPRCSECGERI